jgi:hypothetical protein
MNLNFSLASLGASQSAHIHLPVEIQKYFTELTRFTVAQKNIALTLIL